MKSIVVIVLMLLLSACNMTVKQTPGPVDNGYQQYHTQVDFDMYPACVGSCKQ
jgi:hypothetical protein